MAHLVTSHQGEDHVTSANAAHLHAGILGEGDYVLPVLNRCSCTMVDSNTLRILSGTCVCDGYEWEIEGDYEEVTIDNGVVGYKREDLVVAHIETAPQEKIELRVIKGEDTTGTPVRPGHIAGNLNAGDTVKEMPICAVRLDGINPQEPVMLLEESETIAAICKEVKELRDSQSQVGSRVHYLTKETERRAVSAYGTYTFSLNLDELPAGAVVLGVTGISTSHEGTLQVRNYSVIGSQPYVNLYASGALASGWAMVRVAYLL